MNKLNESKYFGYQTFHFGETEAEVKSEFKKMDEKQFSKRLFAKDPHLWKSDIASIKSISNRLGWLNSINFFLEKAGEIISFADEIKNDGFTHVVLLGMGGSSLCPEVMSKTFGSVSGYPELIVLDNTDPAAILEIENRIKLKSTIFIAASKSGTTTETSNFYKYFYEKLF
jgi:glucose-6-phosphate isomerase